MDYKNKIKNAKSISEIFDIAKEIVWEYLEAEQAGLMVGVSDLGYYNSGFIGAFYLPNSNIIVINKKPLSRILQTNPPLYNFYLFHIILHEYIHSVGSYDEDGTRQLVYEISEHYFGKAHVITQLAANIEKFMHSLTYPGKGYIEPQDINIEFVKGIDKKNINYIG